MIDSGGQWNRLHEFAGLHGVMKPAKVQGGEEDVVLYIHQYSTVVLQLKYWWIECVIM